MDINSFKYGYQESDIRENIIIYIQKKSVSLTKPNGITIVVNSKFGYSSK